MLSLIFLLALSPVHAADAPIDRWVEDLRSTDPSTRETATQKLLELSTPELRETFRMRRAREFDPDARARLDWLLRKNRALELEGRLSPETLQALPHLPLILESGEPYAARKALEIVERNAGFYPMLPAADRNALAQRILLRLDWESGWEDLSESLRIRLLLLLSDAAVDPGQPAIDRMLKLLQDPSRDLRSSAIVALLMRPAGSAPAQAAAEALRRENSQDRGTIVFLLTQRKGAHQLPLILDLMKSDPSRSVRAECFHFLRLVQEDGRGLPIVLKTLEEKTPGNVGLAIDTLRRWGLAKTYEDKIRPFADSPDHETWEAAREALDIHEN